MSEPIVSHGRGGAANISKDPTPYTDGGIIREGPVGDQGNGAYSAGRGGAGNIGSPGMRAQSAVPGDTDVVPETATRVPNYQDFHIGRGGEGNLRTSKDDPRPAEQKPREKSPEGLADKLKQKIFRKKDEKESA